MSRLSELRDKIQKHVNMAGGWNRGIEADDVAYHLVSLIDALEPPAPQYEENIKENSCRLRDILSLCIQEADAGRAVVPQSALYDGIRYGLILMERRIARGG